MAIKAESPLDDEDEKHKKQNDLDDAEPLHGPITSSLFNAQNPQQERDEDQEIHGHVLDFLLLPEEIPNKEADEIESDQII
jgi:hypothetical protein